MIPKETKRMKAIAREVNGYQAAIKELEQEYYNVIRSHHEEWENVTPKLTTICHFLHQPHGYYKTKRVRSEKLRLGALVLTGYILIHGQSEISR